MGSIQRRRHSVEMSIAATEPSKKRQKLSEQLEADAAEVEVSGSESGFSSAIEDELPSEDEQAPDGWPDQDSDDSEEQDILLANARKQGLLKTSKRKRALSPDAFGQSLVSLLSAPEPSAKALAKLNKPMHRTAADDALENKALKLVQAKKHEKREHAHVKDVIANWGPRPKKPFSQWTPEELSQDWVPPEDPEAYVPGGGEGEKVLRRLAQRGTVRLFNAIRAAQGTTEDDLVASARATDPKPTTDTIASISDQVRRKALPAAASQSSSTTAKKQPADQLADVPNLFGTKNREAALANLSKDSFLQILKGKSGA